MNKRRRPTVERRIAGVGLAVDGDVLDGRDVGVGVDVGVAAAREQRVLQQRPRRLHELQPKRRALMLVSVRLSKVHKKTR